MSAHRPPSPTSSFRRAPTAVRGKRLHILQEGLNARHPSESWDPVPFTLCKSLDDSLRSPLRGHPSDVLRAARYVQLRWDDESVALNLQAKFAYRGYV